MGLLNIIRKLRLRDKLPIREIARRTVTLPPTFIQRERDSGFELIRPPTLDRPKAEFPGFDQGDRLVMSPDFVSV
ncbi:hypothetical protein SAMN06265370_1041, partial [Puniceibacterium sediminis]